MGEERLKFKLLNVHICPFVSTSPVFSVLSNKLIWALRLICHFALLDFSPLHSTWNPLASLPLFIPFVFLFKAPFIYYVPWERFLRSPSPGLPQRFLRLHQYSDLFLSLHFHMGLFLTYGCCSHFPGNNLRTGSYVICFWIPCLGTILLHPVGIKYVFVQWRKEDRQLLTFFVPGKLHCEDGISLKS